MGPSAQKQPSVRTVRGGGEGVLFRGFSFPPCGYWHGMDVLHVEGTWIFGARGQNNVPPHPYPPHPTPWGCEWVCFLAKGGEGCRWMKAAANQLTLNKEIVLDYPDGPTTLTRGRGAPKTQD